MINPVPEYSSFPVFTAGENKDITRHIDSISGHPFFANTPTGAYIAPTSTLSSPHFTRLAKPVGLVNILLETVETKFIDRPYPDHKHNGKGYRKAADTQNTNSFLIRQITNKTFETPKHTRKNKTLSILKYQTMTYDHTFNPPPALIVPSLKYPSMIFTIRVPYWAFCSECVTCIIVIPSS